MTPAITASSVSVLYGNVRAVRDADVDVHDGEAVAILGANGAGKSSLLNALYGRVPHTGTVELRGKRVDHLGYNDRWRRGLALVPEGRECFPDMTVLEHLRVPPVKSKSGKARSALIDEVFELFPRLAERRSQLGGTLSGGEQQMLAIGRALVCEPEILMLDEPSLGLAPVICDQVFETLERLKAAGTTILLVEQHAERAFALASRVYIMERGEISLTGTSEQLRNDPAVRQAYLGIADQG